MEFLCQKDSVLSSDVNRKFLSPTYFVDKAKVTSRVEGPIGSQKDVLSTSDTRDCTSLLPLLCVPLFANTGPVEESPKGEHLDPLSDPMRPPIWTV